MRFLAVLFVVAATLSVCLAKDEMQVADLVKQHLSSIGTEQARSAVTSRATEGTVTFLVENSTSGHQDGKEVFVSEGGKFVSLLKLPNPNYHGERFVSDGKKTMIAQVKPGAWSRMGNFVMVHNEILTEGLWGGTLSTAWALAHLDERQAKLQDRGLKKVDGRELRRVDYIPKKRSDLEIQLYFEPDTFRHVMTVYSMTISPQMGRSEIATARQQETRYQLEERFADFKSVDGLTLPQRWTIEFTFENGAGAMAGAQNLTAVQTGEAGIIPIGAEGVGAGNSPVSHFEVTITSVTNNAQLDPKNFEVK
ncbi:MAG TPA: hypothetical protein VKR59_04225 [Terriglobales bacterium]|nr:hypothetical protein [Terriglobales bacterium]